MEPRTSVAIEQERAGMKTTIGTGFKPVVMVVGYAKIDSTGKAE